MSDEDVWAPSQELLRDYQDPGTPPGTLRPAEGESGPSRVVVTSYTADEAAVSEPSDPSAVDRLRGDGRVHWIHVIGLADVALIEHLEKVFDLHPLALEDVLTLGQRPKTEDYEHNVFCVLQHLAYRDACLVKTQVSLFLGTDFVVTFQPGGPDLLAPVRDRIVKGRARMRQKGACYLAYALLDLVVDAAFPALEALGAQLDSIEEGILEKPDQEDIEQLQAARRELLVLRQVLWPQREVVGHLAREEHDLMPDDVRIYFRDCYDHAVQALEVSENFREMASGLLDIYLTSLSHRLNDVMKVLTIISTVFMPLSFLAGVYGMNFDTSRPLNMPELGWKYGYVGFWTISIGAVATMLWLFRRRGWL
jgi:magnesium transporter